MNHDEILEEAKRHIKRDEGLRLKPYLDSVGKLSIAWGRNLDDVGLSEVESEILLDNDMAVAVSELDRALPWWRHLPGPVQCGLINMSLNLGMPRLLGFRLMLAALKAGDFEAAAAEALNSKWRRQVGSRAERIANLYRECEKTKQI